MSPENFTHLDCDDDMVMLEKDIFTVARLKELLSQNLKDLLEKTGQQKNISNKYDDLEWLIDQKRPNKGVFASIAYFLYMYAHLPITDKSITFDLRDILLIFPPTGIECQLLDIKSRKWINGKIRVISDLKINSQHSTDVNIELEFSQNDIEAHKEPSNDERLDDLRAKLNQVNEA